MQSERGLHRLCENVAAEVTRRTQIKRTARGNPPPHLGGYRDPPNAAWPTGVWTAIPATDLAKEWRQRNEDKKSPRPHSFASIPLPSTPLRHPRARRCIGQKGFSHNL